MSKKFEVDPEFQGYVYVGNAKGNYETGQSVVVNGQAVSEKQPYCNMYVIVPCSSFRSPDYEGFGLKAEKLKCVSADVWKDLKVGQRVRIFFDDKKKVQYVVAIE